MKLRTYPLHTSNTEMPYLYIYIYMGEKSSTNDTLQTLNPVRRYHQCKSCVLHQDTRLLFDLM